MVEIWISTRIVHWAMFSALLNHSTQYFSEYWRAAAIIWRYYIRRKWGVCENFLSKHLNSIFDQSSDNEWVSIMYVKKVLCDTDWVISAWFPIEWLYHLPQVLIALYSLNSLHACIYIYVFVCARVNLQVFIHMEKPVCVFMLILWPLYA